MLTNYTKEKLCRPPLSIVEEGKIPKQPPIMDELKYLQDGELLLCDSYSGSDISDPFDEAGFARTGAKLQQVRKKYNKLEHDLKIMNSFSEEFKKSMEETRKEMQILSTMSYEDMSEVNNTLTKAITSPNIPDELKIKIQEVLKDEEFLNVGEEFDIPEPVEIIKKPGEPPEYDEMSGVWNMLKTSKDILVTPPGYHAHRQMKPHWLDRESVPWQKMNEARLKCEEWMKAQPEHF